MKIVLFLKQLNKKRLCIFLFVLSGVFALTAAAVFYVQWNEGVQAERNAKALLAQNNLTSIQSDEEPGGVAEQPTKTEEELAALFETTLKGYTVIARLDIEKLSLSLPVLSKTSPDALAVSVCYYIGPKPGGEGNIVITGHDYSNGAHFGRLDELVIGDIVKITESDGTQYSYTVYETEIILPDAPEALQQTEYDRELTLMTCAQNNNRRLLVRCVQAQQGT